MRQARRRGAAGSVGARVVAGEVVCASARALPAPGPRVRRCPSPTWLPPPSNRSGPGTEAGPVDRADEAGARPRPRTRYGNPRSRPSASRRAPAPRWRAEPRHDHADHRRPEPQPAARRPGEHVTRFASDRAWSRTARHWRDTRRHRHHGRTRRVRGHTTWRRAASSDRRRAASPPRRGITTRFPPTDATRPARRRVATSCPRVGGAARLP